MIHRPKRTVLLNPGPVNISERVRLALQREDLCHREAEFSRLQASIRERLCRAFARHGYRAVLFTGSGTAALEAAVSSSITPGGGFLVVVNGVYGERIARMATLHGARVIECRSRWTAPPDIAAVERLLAAPPAVKVVALVHHETTTGLINPVSEVCALAKRYGAMTLVDSISGLAGENLDVAGLAIDLCVGTANKCIQGVPGMSFVLVREATLARLAEVPPRTMYLHIPSQHAAQDRGDTLFTPAVHVAYAFDEALAELLDEGVGARIARYGEAAQLLRAGFAELDLTFLLDAERRSNTITALALPTGVDYPALHDALKARGFVIYAGQGTLAAEIFRVANMGDVSLDEYRQFLAALAAALPPRARSHAFS